jgi:superoxide dismutase, Cu-Zn family
MHKIKPTRLVGAAAAAAALGVAAVMVLSAPANASRPLARAELQNATGEVIGKVTFKGHGHHADWVEVKLDLPASAPGLGSYHGLHVHTVGQCTAPFTTAGGHWNLETGAIHGSHTGDLPSILVGPTGHARAKFETHRFDVSQLFDADGSAVVLHISPDNFANVPIVAGKYEDPNNWFNNVDPAGTARTGDAGGRYGCGVVNAK